MSESLSIASEGELCSPRGWGERLSSATSFLLNTNDPPTESQSKLLWDAQQRLGYLDAKAARLPKAPKQIQEEREELQRCINAHRVILSPVRRIPIEIVSEIFNHVLDHHYMVFDSTAGPWVLSQICRRWRSIAVSHSAMWSSMSLSYKFGPLDFHYPKDPLALLQTALERSEQHTLDISLNYSRTLGVELGDVQKILDIVMAHAPRWESIDFTLSRAGLSALAEVKGRLQSLFTLRLSSPSVPLHSSPFDAFQDAPLLRTVSLADFQDPELVTLPWSQLRHLSFVEPQYALEDIALDFTPKLMNILRLTPEMETLSITCHGDQAVVNSLPVHAALRSLSLSGSATIPDDVVLPALEALDIGADMVMAFEGVRLGAESLTAVTGLLRRSHCQLKKLSLSNYSLRNNEHTIFIDLLQAASSVKELEIYFTCFGETDDAPLSRLIGNTQSAAEHCLVYNPQQPQLLLLPQLEVLTFFLDKVPDYTSRRTEYIDFVNPRFTAMIESRRVFANPAIAALRKVSLDVKYPAEFPNLYATDIERLKELKANGLDCNISFDFFGKGISLSYRLCLCAYRYTYRNNNNSPAYLVSSTLFLVRRSFVVQVEFDLRLP